jgi:hypothetical protein
MPSPRARRLIPSLLESLESRRLLSAAAVPIDGGLKLRIDAVNSQHIKVTASPDGLSVSTNSRLKDYPGDFTKIVATAENGRDRIAIDPSVAVPAVLHGGSGRDTLIAGGGDSQLFAGSARDLLVAGGGEDTLIALGSDSDTLAGGAAIDSFWAAKGDSITDVTPAETAVGAVHIIKPSAITNEALVASDSSSEPSIGVSGIHYQSFSGDPLFAPAGPSPDDVIQGQLGDCYYLATLASIAQTDPQQIRQDIVQLSDGSFLVRFNSDGHAVYEHVDSQLPVYDDGQLAYAQLGEDNSVWVAVMEKAFAVFRNNADSYANLNGGWMSEAFSDLGFTSTDAYPASAAALASTIQSDLAANEAVTLATLSVPSGITMVADHAYTVSSVTTDDSGDVTGITLRNPWGEAGFNLPANNGYLTLSPADVFSAVYCITAAPC